MPAKKPTKQELSQLERTAKLRHKSFTEKKYVNERPMSNAMVLALGRLYRPEVQLGASLRSPIEPPIDGKQYWALESRGFVYQLWSNMEDKLVPALSNIGRLRVQLFFAADQLVLPKS